MLPLNALKSMELEFIPIEDFYFALTLAVKTLEEIERPGLTDTVRSRLENRYGEPSTIAAASQNTFNYVFRIYGCDNSPAPQLILTVADWQGKLRLSSDYGWMLDAERKPVKTVRHPQRQDFSHQVRSHLQNQLQVPLVV